MSNDTILREVEDELRSDRMRALWKRFGPYVIGAAVAVVLIVAVNEGWSWWQKSNAARSSDQFYTALELAEEGDIEGARAALDKVQAEGSGSYPVLARFREAALLAREGNRSEAVAAYDAIATAADNASIRELALVLAAYLLVDEGDVAAVQQRVGGLAIEGGPMRNAAREAIGLTQYRAGDLSAALQTFESVLEDPVMAPDMRGRLEIYVAQLVAQGARSDSEPATAPPAEAGAADNSSEPEATAPEAATGD